MNGYKAFYRGRSLEVRAASQLAARDEAARLFGAARNRKYGVSVVLVELNGKPVLQSPQFVGE